MTGLFFLGLSLFFFLFGELNDGGGEVIEDWIRFLFGATEAPEVQNPCWTLLNASGAANALRILHGFAFVGEVHDVDTLMANGGADVTRDALIFVRKDAELAKGSLVNVHEGGERAAEAAPNPT